MWEEEVNFGTYREIIEGIAKPFRSCHHCGFRDLLTWCRGCGKFYCQYHLNMH